MSALSAITIEESGDTKIIKTNGVEVDISANGDVIVHTAGHLEIQPVATNNVAQKALKVGEEIRENGVVTAIYAGLTPDGRQQILAMPADLSVTMTFTDAAAAVEKLNDKNTLGHNDWQIPVLENVRVLQKNQNEGALKGTFKTASSSDSTSPDWYWSSTETRGDSSDVHDVRFSDGTEYWNHKDYYHLSCRPVRLVACKAP